MHDSIMDMLFDHEHRFTGIFRVVPASFQVQRVQVQILNNHTSGVTQHDIKPYLHNLTDQVNWTININDGSWQQAC